MPRPRNKGKNKAATKPTPRGNTRGPTNDNQTFTSTYAVIFPLRCLTLEEDGITQCGLLATEGYPEADRCEVHHGQYSILCKKYKDASKVVDDAKNSTELPTKDQIGRYTDWHAALEKARRVRTYLEALRIESAGWYIHHRRFLLKVNDDHRRRVKLLESEMAKSVGVLDALQKRAYELYQPESILHAMNNRALSRAEVELEKQTKQTSAIRECIRNPDNFRLWSFLELGPSLMMPTTSAVGDEDLIDIFLREQKKQMIRMLKPWIDFESFVDASVETVNPRPTTESIGAAPEMRLFIWQQFARRIIFHDPTLFMKSLDRVSLEDLILSDDFFVEDLARFLELIRGAMGFPLRWFKDAVLDVLAISHHGTAANVGRAEDRFPFLGGWVFNRAHTATMSNEAWWLLLKILQPPANIEYFFVRLCNNFEDLVTFLSFEALSLVASPRFCQSPPHFDANDPGLSRNHLSLSGIIVADMVSATVPPQLRGPLPTTRRARKRDCIAWTEMEARAYMFGAVRNERDWFVDAFLRELRARPDLFQVVIRSETAPGRRVEMFGSGPPNSEALPAVRAYNFEAPPSPSWAPSRSGEWQVLFSATDVLYGSWEGLRGYLADRRDPEGWFFRFKTFPVTYFVILDTVPFRDPSALARNVSWAALRARGYVEGEYTLRKYAAASDKLLEQCAEERLGWMPEDTKREIPKMEDQMGYSWFDGCNVV